jgi:VIT1/CCC1 family predicted Fe2+/Mn2+ transporter
MEIKHFHNWTEASYLRNFVFGVEDSLVSTVGLLSGVVVAGVSQKVVFMTGIVLIFVEAFSMAVGSFLSEYSAENYVDRAEVSKRKSIIGSIIMFFSYFIFGFVPLLPYIFFTLSTAFKYSIIFSLVALFLLGMISSRISHTNILRGGIRTAFVGGLAILIGISAGKIVSL